MCILYHAAVLRPLHLLYHLQDVKVQANDLVVIIFLFVAYVLELCLITCSIECLLRLYYTVSSVPQILLMKICYCAANRPLQIAHPHGEGSTTASTSSRIFSTDNEMLFLRLLCSNMSVC